MHCSDQLASSPCDYKKRYIILPRRSIIIVVIAIPFVQVVIFVVYVLRP